MPQSRHRKINRARKRPKQFSPGTTAVSTGPISNKTNQQLKVIAVIVGAAILVTVGYFLLYRDSKVKTASGLEYTDTVVGKGPTPQPGQKLSVKYTGALPNGTVFDSTDKHGGQPFQFTLGKHEVIAGWEEAFQTMKVGGKRHLVIPPKLGYGATGQGKNIPPNSTLVFDVELVGIQ